MARKGKYLTICLVVILAVSSLLIINLTNAESTPIPASTPASISTPKPVNNFALTYNEVSRVSEGANTRLVVEVKAKYILGESLTINSHSFYLVYGNPQEFFRHSVKPIETGILGTIDSNNCEKSFQLTFVFPTMQLAGYQVMYDDSRNVLEVTTPTPIPEFPIVTLLVAVLAAVSLLLIVGKKKLTVEHML
jgi:hypothetical protein